MKKIYPSYYKKFKCIADKCTDNCCIGWEIDIDDETYKKYMNIDNHYLKEKMKEKIENNGDFYFFRLEDDRCPFLNEDNLCEIIQIMGESYLCEICDNHPRYYKNYGSFYDVGIGLSCPEANRLILSSEYEDKLVYDNVLNEDIDTLSKEDKILLSFRNMCFDIMEKQDLTLFEKVNIILYLSYDIQELLDNDDEFKLLDFNLTQIKKNIDFEINKFELKELLQVITKIYLSLEILDEEWKNMLLDISSNIDNIIDFKINVEQYKIEKTIKYFLFRYIMCADEDNDIISKIQLCIVSTIMILMVSSKYLCYDKMARIYSKEIDYSDSNIYDLQQNFIFNDLFSENSFKQITKLLLNL